MIPIRSAAELSAAVKIGTTVESLYLEYKRKAPGPLPDGAPQSAKNNAQMELVADIIQFANAEGGSVLYGIDEGPGPIPGLKTAIAITSVQKPDELKQWIEQAIRNYAVPATFSRDITAIGTNQGVVIAVSVSPSRHLVSLWDGEQHSVRYPKRTSHGQGWMNPDEAERHLMDGSRAARIALLDACKGVPQVGDGSAAELIDGFRAMSSYTNPRTQFTPSDTYIFIADVGEYSFNVKIIFQNFHYKFSMPFGVVKEAWRTPTNRVGLMLDVVFVVQQAVHPKSAMIWFEPRG